MASLVNQRLMLSALRLSNAAMLPFAGTRQVTGALLDPTIRSMIMPIQSRTLFSDERLGVSNFVEVRKKVISQFGHLKEGFIKRIEDCSDMDNTKLVFSEDLKHCLYLFSNEPDELQLLKKALIKYNNQNKEMRFSSFNFGPIIIRLCTLFDLPDFAMELVNNPEISSLFNQASSYVILMELLFRHGRYEEIVQLYNKAVSSDFMASRPHNDMVILLFCANYKLGTPEAFQNSLSVFKQYRNVGAVIARRAIVVLSHMALKQNEPALALEMLTVIRASNYISVLNLRLQCFAKLGHFDDALFVLRNLPRRDLAPRKEFILQESLTMLEEASPELSGELKSLGLSLREAGLVDDRRMEELLFLEIDRLQTQSDRGNRFPQDRFSQERAGRDYREGQGGFNMPKIRSNETRFSNQLDRRGFNTGRRVPFARPM